MKGERTLRLKEIRHHDDHHSQSESFGCFKTDVELVDLLDSIRSCLVPC